LKFTLKGSTEFVSLPTSPTMVAMYASTDSPRALNSTSPANMGDELEEILARPCMQVAQWRKDRALACQADAQKGLRQLSHEQSCLCDTEADLLDLTRDIDAAVALRSDGCRLSQVVSKSVEGVLVRNKAMARVRDQMREAHDLQHHEFQLERRKYEEQHRLDDALNADILCFLQLYKDRLGLSISRLAAQTVRIAFTCIDANNLSKEFSFTLGISADQGYRISDCNPQVPRTAALEARLNRAKNQHTALCELLCAMRCSFKEACHPSQLLSKHCS